MNYGEGYAVFCEQIRFEQGNKQSFLGVVVGDLLAWSPKGQDAAIDLGIAAHVYFNLREKPKIFRLRVEVPGSEVPIFDEDISNIPANMRDDEGHTKDELSTLNGRAAIAVASINLKGIRVAREGFVRVVATHNDSEFLIGRMRVIPTHIPPAL